MKLVEMLSFVWEVEGGVDGGTRRQGTLSLEGLRLPMASIPLMKPLPILFSENNIEILISISIVEYTLSGYSCTLSGYYDVCVAKLHSGLSILNTKI